MSKKAGLRIAGVLALCLIGGPALAWSTMGDGIEYQSYTTGDPNNIFVTRMSRTNTNATIDTMISDGTTSGGRQIVSSQASLYDDSLTWWGGSWGKRDQVVVAINGGLFNMTTGVLSGGMIHSGWYSRSFDDLGGFSGFGWKTSRTPFIGQCVDHTDATVYVQFTSSGNTQAIDGISRDPGGSDLIIFTPQYDDQTPSGTRTEVVVKMSQPNITTNGSTYSSGTIVSVQQNTGSTWIPFDCVVLSGSGGDGTTLASNASVGGGVRIYQQLTDKNEPTTSGTNACQTNTGIDWSNTFSSVNVNYHFLENNAIRSPDPNYDGYAGMIIRNPRTAICYNADYVFFVVCDGRSASSVGWTSDEMATFCKNTLGATDGVNLDGGGSSTMLLNGTVVNVPSDGSERPVANGVMMVNLAPKVMSATFSAGQNVTVASAANVRLGPGTNYGIYSSAAANDTGTVQTHALNGVRAKGYYWWRVSFSGTIGWIAESLLVGGCSVGPIITQDPSAVTIATGGTATFSVTATGLGTLSYQWQKNGTDLSNTGHYSGVTTTTLTVSNCDGSDAADYRCKVTDSAGSIISASAALTVTGAPGVLLNAGFENWAGSVTADNWIQYNATGTVVCYKGSTFSGSPTVSPHGGSECQRVKLDSNNEQGGVYQLMAATPGAQYTISAWLLTRLTAAGQAEAKLGVDPTGATVPGANTTWSTTVTGDSSWTQKSLTVTATGSFITVFLNGRHPENSTSQCNVFFDDAAASLNCSGPTAPTSASASPSTICSGASSTLTVSGGSGTTCAWYTGSCGGTLVGTGTSINVSPTTTTTYYVRWMNDCANSTCVTTTVTVNSLPTAPSSASASPASICSGASSTLTVSGGSGSTCAWYTASCGGTLVGTGTSINVSPTSTTTYYARWMSGCGNSTCVTTSVTVNAVPSAPTGVTASPSTINVGQSSTLSGSVAGGCTIDWYKVSCGGTLQGSGTSLNVSPTVTTAYYPRARNTTTGCVSASCGSTVTVTVNGPSLLNAGFETWTGTVTANNWTQYTTTGSIAPSKGTTFTGSPSVAAHGGSQFQRVKLAGNGYQGGVYQRFSSTSGVQYTISAYLITRITSSTQAEAKLGLDPSGATTPGANTVWSSTVTGDSSWTKKTLTVTATGSYITIFLNGRHPTTDANQCNVFFDDVSSP